MNVNRIFCWFLFCFFLCVCSCFWFYKTKIDKQKEEDYFSLCFILVYNISLFEYDILWSVYISFIFNLKQINRKKRICTVAHVLVLHKSLCIHIWIRMCRAHYFVSFQPILLILIRDRNSSVSVCVCAFKHSYYNSVRRYICVDRSGWMRILYSIQHKIHFHILPHIGNTARIVFVLTAIKILIHTEPFTTLPL